MKVERLKMNALNINFQFGPFPFPSGELMRITVDQAKTIKQGVIHYFGETARVYLFGSRVDDSKKGGDIDLLIEADYTPEEMFMKKVDLLTYLHLNLGERKIDIVTYSGAASVNPLPLIVEEALSTGVML